MEEKILCAAIWCKELNTPYHRPKNTDWGCVICGHRHHDCIQVINALTGKRLPDVGESILGFLTNKNRFVDRIEGGEIALKSKQIDKLSYSKNKLFSEDLY